MKKFTLLFIVALLAGNVIAQQVSQTPIVKKYGVVPTSKQIPSIYKQKAPGDTLGINLDSWPTFNFANITGGYGLTDSQDNLIGYWWGTNGAPADTAIDNWIQVWDNLGTNKLKIAGVGFYCINKNTTVSGTPQNDTVFFSINKLYSDGCMIGYAAANNPPQTYGRGPKNYLNSTGNGASFLAGTYMTVADIDTSLSAGLIFNYAPLTAPVTVTGTITDGLAIVANFHQPRVNGDTVYLVCDSQGDGMMLRYGQQGNMNADGSLYWLPMSNFFTYEGSDGGLDNNAALFAVITTDAGLEADYFQGIKMDVRTTSDGPILDYAIENNCGVSVNIHDISGKLVKAFDEGSMSAGQHSISLTNLNLSGGEYIIVISAGNGRMAEKFIF